MRYFAFKTDPTAGGSTLEDVETTPTILSDPAVEAFPVTTGQANANTRQLSRENDVTGVLAESAPIAFASAPNMTFEARAWTRLFRAILPRAQAGAISNAGVAPAPVSSTVQTGSGPLPAIIGTLVREGQTDRETGLVVSEFEANFPIDEEGTLSVTLEGKYHEVSDTASIAAELDDPAGIMPDYAAAYMLRDIEADLGDGVGVPIDCLAGFGFTIGTGLIDDFRSRFCAGRNILEAEVDGEAHRLWYPTNHKRGRRRITGRLDFSDVRPDRELRRILSHAEKLVVNLYGDPLGTTPDADESVRLTFFNQAPTGGGADPLQAEGDQVSSYEFTAYLDPATGKDLESVLVGDAAVNVPALIG